MGTVPNNDVFDENLRECLLTQVKRCCVNHVDANAHLTVFLDTRHAAELTIALELLNEKQMNSVIEFRKIDGSMLFSQERQKSLRRNRNAVRKALKENGFK